MADLFLEQTKVFAKKKLKDFNKKTQGFSQKTQSYGGNMPQVAS